MSGDYAGAVRDIMLALARAGINTLPRATESPSAPVWEHVWGELVAIRRDRGISQEDMAERVGYARHSLSMIETGRRGRHDLRTMTTYAAALDIDLHFVLTPRTRGVG